MGRENHGYGGLLHTTTPQNNALWVEMAGRNANDTGQPHRLYQRTLWRTRNHFFSQHTHVDRVLQRTRPGWWWKLDQVGPIVTVPVTVHHNSASASARARARARARAGTSCVVVAIATEQLFVVVTPSTASTYCIFPIRSVACFTTGAWGRGVAIVVVVRVTAAEQCRVVNVAAGVATSLAVSRSRRRRILATRFCAYILCRLLRVRHGGRSSGVVASSPLSFVARHDDWKGWFKIG